MFQHKKSKSKIFSTYSKRKQFVRIVRDQWHDVQNSKNEDSFDNVFDLPRPNTSTPLHAPCTFPKSSPVKINYDHVSPQVDLKPINLASSGLFDDSPEISSASHRRMNRTKSRNASKLSITKDLSHDSHKSSTFEPSKQLAIVPEVMSRSVRAQHRSRSRLCDVSKDTNSSSSSISSNKTRSQSSNTSNCVVIEEVKNCNRKEISNDIGNKENIHDNSGSLFTTTSDESEDKSCHSIFSANDPSDYKSCHSIISANDPSVIGSCDHISMLSVCDQKLEIGANIVPKSSIMEISVNLDKSKNVSIVLDKSNELEQSINRSMSSPCDQELEVPANDISVSSEMEISVNLDKSKNVCIDLDKSNELERSINRSILLDKTTPSFIKLKDQCRVVPHYFDDLLSKNRGKFIKIGEGCFGEVYMDQDTVYKVVPVGGTIDINGAEQTTYENALQEIIVSKMLSGLAGDVVQMGKAFCQLKDIVLTSGIYPHFLLELWDKFEKEKSSENERPDVFPSSQHYVVLLSRYSGVQLEDYCCDNNLTPNQAHSIIRQCCCSLAAAEKQYQFEHRDLHWGNVLINKTSTELVEFATDGKEYILRSHGLLATIIDFTFSRLETNGCLNFVDLENEEWLFQGDQKVDIQFKVYRDMRRACRKNWAKFTPKTNVHWLSYLIEKMNMKIKSKKLKNLLGLISNKKSASDALPYVMRSL